VGRGWTVPAGLIGPQVRIAINELCGKLGYVPVDENWGTADKPADLRVPVSAPEEATGESSAEAGEGAEAPSRATVAPAVARVAAEPGVAKEVGERLAAALQRIDGGFASRWEPCGTESFLVVATPPDGGGPGARWWVDLSAGTVTTVDGDHPAQAEDGEDGEDATGWDVIASVDTWDQVFSGRTNLSVALRRHQLRYLEQGESGPFIADTRLGMLADLLGLASWGQVRQDR
jgi:hypothetical protein